MVCGVELACLPPPNDPSPGPRRLKGTPTRATLSPKDRADFLGRANLLAMHESSGITLWTWRRIGGAEGEEMSTQQTTNKDDLIVIGGAGGFIAGALTRYFHDRGFNRIRAIDKKPLQDWYQRVPGVESLCLDLSEKENCVRACEGAVEVYNLAADMGAWASSRSSESNACAAS